MLRQLTRDRLDITIYPDRAAMGAAAAGAGVRAMRAALERKETITVMFAAAPSQEELLQNLSCADVDWSRVNACHMDEYVGLDPAAPQRFSNFLRARLFDRLPFRGVHCIRSAASAQVAREEAERYEAFLRRNPLDVCFMGIGENGHIAFNDPSAADFQDPKWVKVVELERACRLQQVHDGCFTALEEVPSYAITATIPALFSAGQIICTVPGSTKAQAVRDILEEPVMPQYPASILTTHPAAALFLDQAAASLALP